MAGLVVAGLTTWQYEGTTAKKKHEHRISYLTGGGLLMESLEARPTGMNGRGLARNSVLIMASLGGLGGLFQQGSGMPAPYNGRPGGRPHHDCGIDIVLLFWVEGGGAPES